MNLRVLLREVATGREAWHEDNYTPSREGAEFLWTEGNYGCDCNRALFLARALGENEPDDTFCSDKGIVVVAATLDGEPFSEIVDEVP